jgi:hypothetical protein
MAGLTRLEKLVLAEVSAVDAPANESDGWAVLKSRSAAHDRVASELTAELRKLVDEQIGGTAADIAAQLDLAVQPFLEVAKALLSRIEALETLSASSARKSIEGQDDIVAKGDGQPTLGDAFDAVLKGHKVTLA